MMKVLERIINTKRNQMFWLWVMAMIAVLVFGQTGFADLVWDVTVADFVATNADKPVSGQSISQQGSNYKVLWDISHDVDTVYRPSGSFQPLVQNLESHEFSFDTTSQGFLVDDPASYDVVVVCLGSAWYSAYSSAEVTRITDFIDSGGGLLIMGDNSDCPNANIQPVASAFGVSLGLSFIKPNDTYTSDLSTHPILDEVSQIYMIAAGEISASAPSGELAWQEETGKALVAAGTYGNGRVVTLGDINLFAQYYDLVDNRRFSINTFEYLAVPEPATLLLLGLGGLALLRKRKA